MKNVYLFGEIEPDKALLGGKGASLATMTRLGLRIPPGFTITTKTCIEYLKNNDYPEGLWDEIKTALKRVEADLGKEFGNVANPLLVSVRSGAKISMPGMMDTVLNVGLNQDIVKSLSEKTNKPRFVKDAYRRLIQMFSDVVCDLDIKVFHEMLENKKKEAGVQYDYELSEENLDELIKEYLAEFQKQYGEPFPQDPYKQLDMAIKAVFRSWNNKRAIDYRNFEGISHDIGTAVNVQAMAFGNYDDNSGTGVLFTRNPATGEKKVFGEFLVNAQGEDVVAGIRTPMHLDGLQKKWPDVYAELMSVVDKLEKHYKDMQDVEFTIEQGRLFILQTRNAKRTGVAAAKIAYDMVNEGLIDKKVAVQRITYRDVEESLFPRVIWKDKKRHFYYDIKNLEEQLKEKTLDELMKESEDKLAQVIGKGLPAGPGAASGHVVFDSDLAEGIMAGKVKPSFNISMYHTKDGKKVPSLILVKNETSPEDFHGMVASVAIITMTGGMTSHAALVGRQIGKRVIVGAASSGVQLQENKMIGTDGSEIKEGDIISVEIFESGMIFNGALPIYTPSDLPMELQTILDWADEIAQIKVRANADKENDTRQAVEYKTTGTGLARTEHQFFDALPIMQEMILAENEDERNQAIDKMAELQKQDFIKLFTIADGRPITIRLLDPPLHEFLPKEIELREKLWKGNLDEDERIKTEKILERVLSLKEANPMLGLRGVRLGLLIPELTQMQARAILEAAIEVKKTGKDVHPEIMVPLIGTRAEFTLARKYIDETAEHVFEKYGVKIPYKVGTMIEIPRAALTADEIAGGELGAEFFSFGTNDLHQMTFGYSRDDVAKFLPFYLEEKILSADPFQTIDVNGTGKLMSMCVELGRKAAEEAGRYLKVGICGEQGGDPASIEFCYTIGLDYVSCSPFRIPIARLAAAHATLKHGDVDPKYRKKLNI